MDMRCSGGAGGCISRYSVHGSGGYHGRYDISMVDRMMMTKFRPIAPRPAASVCGSGDSMVDNSGVGTRGKRKYVRVKSFNKNSKKRKVVSKSPERGSCGGDTVVTLPLMPETPDRKENSQQMVHDSHVQSRTYLSHKISGPAANHGTSYKPQTVSYVTVEHVTKSKVDSGLLGWREMENDSCPRFVSDNNGDRVVWCNKAYKEMVAGGDHVVVIREDGELPVAFTCNVKVTCRGSVGCLTVPCDAWRLEGGGCAWRLDVKAALCLGRSSTVNEKYRRIGLY